MTVVVGEDLKGVVHELGRDPLLEGAGEVACDRDGLRKKESNQS